MYHKVAVRLILRNDKGCILFLKRKNAKHANGKWCLPGGKIGALEKIEDACRKEIKEETNLDISDIKLLFYNNDFPVKNESDKYYLGLYFTANFSGEIRLNDESSEYAWISPNRITDFNIAFNHDKIVKKFLSGT